MPWPQDTILGGNTKQRVTYDQLTITQFVQGFARNMLDEDCHETREKMLWYLSDLMEDATDFLWGSAKALHAVLLCEMERGTVNWSNTSRIDRIRGAHAQKHINQKQNWARTHDSFKKPWFCKLFQNGQCSHSKDHELAGKLHRHICAYCLSQGRILPHAEKECTTKKLSKNGQTAAQTQ